MNSDEIAREWFTFAQADLEAALILKDSKPALIEIICYHCQQSAEKYLKGYLLLKGEVLSRTHELLSLQKGCNKYADFSPIKDDCTNLADYAVQVRYPFHQFDLTTQDMELAIQSAQNLQAFLGNLLGHKI